LNNNDIPYFELCSIRFISDGHTVKMVEAVIGQKIRSYLPIIQKEGYSFAGWFSEMEE